MSIYSEELDRRRARGMVHRFVTVMDEMGFNAQAEGFPLLQEHLGAQREYIETNWTDDAIASRNINLLIEVAEEEFMRAIGRA